MASILISRTQRKTGKGSDTDRVYVFIEHKPDQPYFEHRWVEPTTDMGFTCYWVLDQKLHDWFIQADIPYKLVYEMDWWVEVAEEHALMVKLTWGGDVSLN